MHIQDEPEGCWGEPDQEVQAGAAICVERTEPGSPRFTVEVTMSWNAMLLALAVAAADPDLDGTGVLEITDADAEAIRMVIRAQLAAFRARNADRAYALASPDLQEAFDLREEVGAQAAPQRLEDLPVRGFRRQALHAQALGLIHPASGETVQFDCPLPEDMLALLAVLEQDLLEVERVARGVGRDRSRDHPPGERPARGSRTRQTLRMACQE